MTSVEGTNEKCSLGVLQEEVKSCHDKIFSLSSQLASQDRIITNLKKELKTLLTELAEFKTELAEIYTKL